MTNVGAVKVRPFARRLPLALLVLTTLSLGAIGMGRPVTTAAQGDDSAAAIDAFVRAAMQTYGVPGAAVAVVKDDLPLLVRGYGVRQLGDPAPVNADTVFQLASNTKPMTAALLATLVDEGKLGWDDPVIDHLPEFALANPYATRYATVRDLLAMRTGLPAFEGDLLGLLGYDRAEVLRRLRYMPLATSLREEAAYSNAGYFIAGEVAARLAGLSWDAAMTRRLFVPLGMNRSGTGLSAVPADGNWARGSAEIDGSLQTVPWDNSDVFGAAGSAVSTANDMVLWVRMLLADGSLDGHQLLKPQTVADMFEPSMVAAPSFTELPPIGPETGFGYSPGWGYYYFHGHKVLEKGGALAGVRTIVELVPDLHLGIAVLANRNLVALPEAARAFVLERYMGATGPDTQQQILKAQRSLDALLQPAPPPANPGPASLPMSGYAGTYTSPLYGQFVVSVAGDGLQIEAGPAHYPIAFTHRSYDTFNLIVPGATNVAEDATFTIGTNGLATQLDTETYGSFKRVSAPGSTAAVP